MSKIAVLITDMFEDSEYLKPAENFKKNGHTLKHIGLKKGATVHGKKQETPVTIDQAVANVSINDYDVLFIPGGYSPDKLRVNQDAVTFVKNFVKSGKPVFVICHAPQLLITADVLHDRTITGWKSIAQDITNAGATYLDQEVVIDDNLISSRSPKDLPAFIKESNKKLK